MTDKSWGQKVRELRKARGMTQQQLADKSGLGRGFIAQIEAGLVKVGRRDTFVNLARGFNMSLDDLNSELSGAVSPASETPEQMLERLRLAQPIAVPVRKSFSVRADRVSEALDYVYLPRAGRAGKNIEGFLAKGGCLGPTIEENDVVIIDRDMPIARGDIVACIYNSEFHLGRLILIAGETFIEDSHGRIKLADCAAAAAVIQVVRKLK